MKTVYADVVLFENFLIDYILLRLSMVSMYLCVKTQRLILSSVMLSLYSVAVSIVSMGQIAKFMMSLFMLLCASFVTLGKRSVKVHVRFCLTMYVFSFLLYGFVESAPFINGTASCLVTILLLVFFVSFFKKVPEKILFKCDAPRVQTEIVLGENTYSFLSVCDSGNFLIDPQSNLPVIIVGEGVLNIQNMEITSVPFKTISGEGKLCAITPDEVRVKYRGKWHRVTAVIGISENLQRQTQFAEGIFPARVLQNL